MNLSMHTNIRRYRVADRLFRVGRDFLKYQIEPHGIISVGYMWISPWGVASRQCHASLWKAYFSLFKFAALAGSSRQKWAHEEQKFQGLAKAPDWQHPPCNCRPLSLWFLGRLPLAAGTKIVSSMCWWAAELSHLCQDQCSIVPISNLASNNGPVTVKVEVQDSA